VLMLDLVDRQRPGAPIERFTFKAVHPAFVPHRLAIRAQREGGDVSLWVESAGFIASTGRATLGASAG